MEIRRSYDRLISTMGFPILVRRHLYIESRPLVTWGLFYKHGLTLISTWKGNRLPSKVWDNITHPYPNFNGCTVEVWEWLLLLLCYCDMHAPPRYKTPWYGDSFCIVNPFLDKSINFWQIPLTKTVPRIIIGFSLVNMLNKLFNKQLSCR